MVSREQQTRWVYLNEYTQVSTRVEFQFNGVVHLPSDRAFVNSCIQPLVRYDARMHGSNIIIAYRADC